MKINAGEFVRRLNIRAYKKMDLNLRLHRDKRI